MTLHIHELEDHVNRFYVYTDVAEMFWPGDYGKSNHEAEARIQDRMLKEGCTVKRRGSFSERWETPVGSVLFDTESGGLNFFAPDRAPVAWVKALIETMLAERDELRAKLA